ncbi:MAG: hypothetical protein IPP94_09520 [Ignavibacteria bacterium]|nr:hypothetical protein [Ignavibacteria bacterium]
MTRIILLALQMYGIAAVISFFVALLIKGMNAAMQFSKHPSDGPTPQ